MADPNAAKLPYENPLAAIGGGYYGQLAKNRPPDMPMRPPGQEVARMPPGPQNFYVDQVDNGQARLLDDKGNAHMEPAKDYYRESRMTDGSQPVDDKEGLDLRAKLSAGDRGGTINLSEPPPVPLAPGSPGPPIPPAADSMIGQKKRSGDTKRRRIP